VKNTEFSEDVKMVLINSIQEFFLNERAEEISSFQASIILDFMLTSIGPIIYNQAIADAYALMNDRIEDLYGLEKRPR